MKELWRNRVFLIVFSTDLLENIGVWIRNMALLFFVMEISGNNPTAVSLLTAIEYVPILLFSVIGGALADRWDPKRTMISANLLSSLSVCVIAVLLWKGYWSAVFSLPLSPLSFPNSHSPLPPKSLRYTFRKNR